MYIAVDFFASRGDDGHLRAVHHGAVRVQSQVLSANGLEGVVVGGGTFTFFFHGLGLFTFMDHAGNQPFAIKALVVVAFEREFGTGAKSARLLVPAAVLASLRRLSSRASVKGLPLASAL